MSTLIFLLLYELWAKPALTDDIYTIHIDAHYPRICCTLYRFTISEFQKIENDDKLFLTNPNIVFKANGENNFTEKMQEFFFDKLSFYNLQYHHRPGNKNESVEADLSWSTYFKSIYLEASNYKYLYFEQENIGRQGTKILEMLLGLKLTYPINQLTLLRDMKKEKLRNNKFVLNENKRTNKDNLEQLTKELEEVEKKLSSLSEQKDFQSFENLINEYNHLQVEISHKKTNHNKLQNSFNSVENKLKEEKENINELSTEIKKRQKELKQIEKNIIVFMSPKTLLCIHDTYSKII